AIVAPPCHECKLGVNLVDTARGFATPLRVRRPDRGPGPGRLFTLYSPPGRLSNHLLGGCSAGPGGTRLRRTSVNNTRSADPASGGPVTGSEGAPAAQRAGQRE